MTRRGLTHIRDELLSLANLASAGDLPDDPKELAFALRVLARQADAQLEMVERDVAG